MKRGHRVLQCATLGILLLLAIGLASCGGGGGGVQTTATGLVRNADTGGLLPGATVLVGTKSAITDAAGSYTVANPPLGPQSIQCAAAGYQSFPAPGSGPVQILIAAGPNPIQTILLVPVGALPPPTP